VRVSLQITLVGVFRRVLQAIHFRLLWWGWELRVRGRRRVDLRGCLPHGLKLRMNSAINRLLALHLLHLRLLDSLKWGVSGVAVRGQQFERALTAGSNRGELRLWDRAENSVPTFLALDCLSMRDERPRSTSLE
jgi:hypothetical protein